MKAEEYDRFHDIGISCGFCGHQDKWGRFATTALGGYLPIHVFQCPSCMTAWSMKSKEDTQKDWDHWYHNCVDGPEPTRVKLEVTRL